MTRIYGVQHGITVNGKHSFDDFGLVFNDKSTGIPAPKIVRKNIPYMNGTHDFSKLNGEIMFDPVELKYVFDVVGNNAIEMNELKSKVVEWLIQTHDTDLYDDDVIGKHYAHVSLVDISWEEDDGQGKLSLKFEAYPYQIADVQSSKSLTDGNQTAGTITTSSSHMIMPTVVTTGAFSITLNGKTYSVAQAGTYQMFKLAAGENQITFTGSATITWNDEVF